MIGTPRCARTRAQVLEQAQIVGQVLAKPNAGIGPDFAAASGPRRGHTPAQLVGHFVDHVVEMNVGLHVGRLAAQVTHHHGGLGRCSHAQDFRIEQAPDTSLTAVAPSTKAARAVAAL